MKDESCGFSDSVHRCIRRVSIARRSPAVNMIDPDDRDSTREHGRLLVVLTLVFQSSVVGELND